MAAKMIPVTSAWKGLELIIKDIMNRFNVARNSCIEFGFSTVVFSNYLKTVKGIDTFIGDEHTMHKEDHYDNELRRRIKIGSISQINRSQDDLILYVAKDLDVNDVIVERDSKLKYS